MTKVMKRALELLHLGYVPKFGEHKGRIFPKWKQCLAIAIREEQARRRG
jgi:hypothetical protein